MSKRLTEREKRWIERTVSNNRNYKLFLYNRFFLFLLLVLAQLGGYVALWYLFAYHSAAGVEVKFATSILAWIVVLRLINKYDKPSLKLNWILLILIAPIFGVPAYLLYGEGRPTKRMRQKIERAKAENDLICKEDYGEPKALSVENRAQAIGKYLQTVADYPSYADGDVRYYDIGDKMFLDMLEDLRKAEKYILVEYFIIAHGKMWGEILKILLEKAALGVQVRIIYDDFGCMMTLPPKYDRYLESLHENIRCMTFNNVVPVFAVRMNNRDHRKILVIDGKVGYTGGVNVADEYIGEVRRFGHWKDTGVRITGNAVTSFIKMFFTLWNAFRKDKEDLRAYLPPANKEIPRKTGQEIQPYDDSPFDEVSLGETVYLDMINSAVKYVYIFTPYLILDDSMRAALCLAALRGVDVRIVTPGIPDKKTVYRLTRANYSILMKAGVKIYEYTPGFIHAKSMLCDDERAVVGTINLDYRSLYLHFENAVYFKNVDAIADLKRDCEETFTLSLLCTPENTKRGVFARMRDSFLRLFETLL